MTVIRISEPIPFRNEEELAGVLWTMRALVNKGISVQLACIDSKRSTVTLYTRVNRGIAKNE
jgi:hypothetical protein